MRFMTKNAPSTTIETKKVTATYAFPMASKTCMHSPEREKKELTGRDGREGNEEILATLHHTYSY